ncbi:hypothetical protein [Opitutus sp. ER46]|uniref:hypothetical protein n=1 Tax=Opitutus sp. ER46 TaxID=2161864 RepID=UPI000D30B248|nr:hypothetical protein [Opitutus sp. ER46]PTX95685.1 hypothetical protein DB354_09740 [Opitutus sp. ER46]
MDRPPVHRLGFGTAALAVLLLAACAHRPPRTLTSSFEALDPLAAPAARQPAGGEPVLADTVDVVTSPRIYGNARPTLSAATLAAVGGQRTFIVTVTYDENGTVTDVAPSLRGLVLRPEHADEVLRAIAAAVHRWRIVPARVIHYRVQANGERLYLGADPLGGRMDFKFTFGTDAAGDH